LYRWYYAEVSSVVDKIGYRILSASESGFGLTGWVQTASNVSIIWDLIVVRSYYAADARTNVSDFVDIDVLLEYEFDDSFVVDGTVLINSISASYQGSGIWRISETRSSVVSVLYNAVSCSGNTHNITNVNQNGESISIIWDRIIVNSYTVIDSRVNINAVVNIDVTLTYEFDDDPVTDGTVSINGFSAAPQGSGVWRISQSQGSVQSVSFDTVVCYGNTYGIAVVNQDSQSQDVIWDQVVVQSYTILDSRINVDDSANIDFLLHYGYDDADVTNGLVTINGITATHQGSGVWRIGDTKSSVQLVNYNTVVCSGNSHGISSVDQNGQAETIIWDQIIVRSYSVDDDRVNLDTVVVINVTLEYEYDSSSVVNGVVIIQSVSSTHVENGIWQISMSKSSVQMVTLDTVVCSGNTLGISSVNQNSQSQNVIWDRIRILTTTVDESRLNKDATATIMVTAELEYDNHPLGSGDTLYLDDSVLTWDDANSWFYLEVSQSTVGLWNYYVNTTGVAEADFGISLVTIGGLSQDVIWDQIVVIGYQVLDTRVNIDDSVNIDVILEFKYDSTDVETGSVSIDGIGALNQGGGVWRISVAESAVGQNTYTTVICSGNAHSITTVDQNGQSTSVIWDQINVRSLIASDERDSIGATITVSITLEYEHDDSDVTDGSVLVNSIPFTYTGSNGVWSTNRLQNSVTFEDYDLTVVSGNEYDISLVDQNGQSLRIIWDRITILSTTVDFTRLNTDAIATIMVTAELEYDHHALGSGDTLVIDGSIMTWGGSYFYLEVTQSTVGLWNYYVNNTGAAETDYGISQVNTAGISQDVIWDQLSITINPDDTSVYDYDSVSFTLDVEFSYDSTPCTTYVLEIYRNNTYWKSFTTLNVSQFIDSNIDLTYNYSTFIVISESALGITVFTTNVAEVTWSTPTNFAPIINGDPTLDNPDDTDNMYATFRSYLIFSSVVDYDGYSDVDYVELSLWDNNRLFEVWRVRYTSSTGLFSVENGIEYIQLSPGCSNLSINYLLNITWSIEIDWDHFDLQNIDLYQFVVDLSAVSADGWLDSDWDVETRLEYTILPWLSDDRGDLNTDDLQASGRIVYYGSSISPLSSETDVWVVHDFSGSWSGNINALGVISVAGIGSSSTVRENTYTFKIVADGQGPGSTDLFYATSPTDTFITDQIEFYLSGVADSRINIHDQGDVWFSARYQFDGTDIQSGFEAYLNGINLLSWDALNSRWHYQEVRVSPVNVSYQISSATEFYFGITSWELNTTDQSIIWDSLIITIDNPDDRRININEYATGIVASAIYSFDSATFNGTVLLNNTVFLYSSVQRQYYTVSSVFGGPYNITYIAINDLTWCIWDQIEVVSISTDITYLDPNEYVRVQAELRYDFDDAPVEDGNFSLKFVELEHVADGIWEANVTRSFYQSVSFDTLTVCEAAIFGITSFDMYSNARVVYWDRLEFFDSYSPDYRIDVGTTGFIIWSIRLQNANITITSGITAEVTDGSLLTYIDDGWQSSHSSELVGDITFSIASASLEGIDFFMSSTNDETIIWDRIRVVTTSATSTTPEIEHFIQIQVSLLYEYDDTPVTDGVVSLWDDEGQISMTYNVSGGFWYANITKVEIGNYTFYVSATSGNQYGITVVDLDANIIIVEFVPALLPRLTTEMIVAISSGFGIILLISGILVRKKYLVKVPYEVKQINRALKSMEKEEKVEPLDLRTLEQSLFAELEPGMAEIGLVIAEVLGDISPEEVKDTWVPDSDADLLDTLDIMDEFKLPEYKQEIDEGELDISILSESESEEAWSIMLKEVRRIESKEGRKVPLTKDDWIDRIPTEVKNIFFEEELRELDIAELEHLTKLTPSEVEEIMGSISQTEDMYASLEPEASAAAISSALSDRMESQPTIELDEEQKKERLFELLPAFVKEFFSTTWLEKLSSEEIEELLTIPESELKLVIESLAGSRETKSTTAIELEIEAEVADEAAPESEPEFELDAKPEVEDKVKPKIATQDDIKAELIAELKGELKIEPEDEIESEPEVEPEADLVETVIEYDDPRMADYVEKYGEAKANILITIPEDMLEGIPENQIKKMNLKTTKGLKQALEEEIAEDEPAEDTAAVVEIPDPEDESEDTLEGEPNNDLLVVLDLEYEAKPDDKSEDEAEHEE
ncbi:MAG: hypothetical protein RTV31_14550, partial [Candidatus Thorarchaeota archaeon]